MYSLHRKVYVAYSCRFQPISSDSMFNYFLSSFWKELYDVQFESNIGRLKEKENIRIENNKNFQFHRQAAINLKQDNERNSHSKIH
jgi:hypothetical protein